MLAKRVPTGGDWSFEIKWDGYRLAVHVEPSRVRILTRGGHDWTHRFPAIEAEAKALGPSTMILDGEAVVLDAVGRSNFGRHSAAGVGSASPARRCFLPSTLSTSTATTCAAWNSKSAGRSSKT